MFQRDHLVTMHSSTALQLTHPHPIPSMAFPFRNSTTTHHSNRKNLRFCHGFGPLAATGPTAAGSCFPVPGTTAQPGAGVSTTCAAAPSGGGTRRRYPWYHGVTWRIHQSLVRRFPMKNMTTFEDVQCLPFEICQARRDAASLSFVGTSCAASLLKLSHVAKAWQWGFCHGRSPEWMVYFMSPNLKRMITGYIKYPHFRKHPLGHIVVVVFWRMRVGIIAAHDMLSSLGHIRISQ